MKIICRNLAVKKKGKSLLSEISFAVPAGGFVSLLGPNGSGKTTLMRCLAGCESHYSGIIEFPFEDKAGGVKSASHPSVAFVPEDTSIPFPFSAFDIALMGRFPQHRGNPTKQDRTRAMEALEKVGISSLYNQSAMSMSTGERRKTMLARALASDAEIMLLDELVANLDILAQLEVVTLLKRLCTEEKKTIILSLHDLSIAVQATPLALILKNSRQVAFGPVGEILTSKLILDVFGVQSEEFVDSRGAVNLIFKLKTPDQVDFSS
jgi:iron complex transport system ATP-binding protein